MKSLIPETSTPSIIKHADGDFYTRYFAPVYDYLTSLSGWRSKIACHALDGLVVGKLLDVGCGTGYLMDLARKRHFEVTGLDASIGMLQKGMCKYGFTDTEMILGSANKLPFESNSFDVVIACGSLVHIPDIEGCAEEMIRVVKQGGVIRIVDHAVPVTNTWRTPFFKMFSQLSGDILHAYDSHFQACQKVNHVSIGRGGYMQLMDYKKA